MLRAILFFFCLYLNLVRLGLAAPAFDVSLSHEKIRIPETTNLTIRVSWPKKDGQYSFGIPQIPLKNLTKTNESQSQESFIQDGEEWTQKIFVLEFKPENPGEGNIGGFVITYLNPEIPESTAQFIVNGYKIKIRKAAIKFQPWMGIGAGALLLTAIGSFFLFRKKAPQQTTVVTPSDKALEQLKQTQGSVKDIQDVLRHFLSEQFSLPANFSSTDIKSSTPEDEFKVLKPILDKLEQIKFTGQSRESDLGELRKDVINYIESKRVVGSPALS